MLHSLRTHARIPIALLAVLLTFGACAVTGGGTSGGNGGVGTVDGKVTPVVKPCSTKASATMLTYASGPNIAGVSPAPPGAPSSALPAVSNFPSPLGIPDEGAVGNDPKLTFTAIAPDAKHLAVAVLQQVPFSAEFNPFIVDTGTKAATRVALASPITYPATDQPPRIFAWADTHTLIIFANPGLHGPAGSTYSYDINTKALTALPGADGAIEGVVRCGVLFYSTLGSFAGLGDVNHSQVATLSLHRYDLGTNSAIGAPIDLGKASTWGGAEGQVDFAGWDASPDGSHIVYQHESVAAGPTVTSTWFAANADGSGAVAILPKLTSNSGARMAISPDAKLVAVTSANPSPNVASGPVSGASTTFFDTPDGYDQPAWLANSSGFFADSGLISSPLKIALYSPCGGSHCNGTPAVVKADFPATLP